MTGRADVLIVDDDKPTLELIATILRGAGHEVSTARSAEQAVEMLREKHYPVVVSDINLGKWDGLALIPYTKQQEKPCAIIFLTGEGSMETAVKAVREGAFDYLSKAFDPRDLEREILPAVDRALRHVETVERGADGPVLAIEDSGRHLVGKSPAMVNIYRIVAKAALSHGSVLVTGESGTGKELVARAIHENGVRAKGPFVAVNCCALTETLLESELFGHVKGSFTGAVANKVGLFEQANGGTLFLDEIGDLSPTMQVKLLRALQEGEIKPVGAVASRKIDVRVIAATHRHLKDYIHEGKFREDLYYRLKVFLIEIPALRERQRDIPELARYFVGRSAKKTGKEGVRLSDDAVRVLASYPWPGNIREMENAIERAVSMTSTTILFPEDFPEELRASGGTPPPAPARVTEPVAVATAAPADEPVLSLDELEHRHILKVLQTVNYNRSRAAELLGIDRTTLYRKAARYGIELGKPEDVAHASPPRESRVSETATGA